MRYVTPHYICIQSYLQSDLFSIPIITIRKFLPTPLQPVSKRRVIVAQFNNFSPSHPLQSPLLLICRVIIFLNFIGKRSGAILFIPPPILPFIHDVQEKRHRTIQKAERHSRSMSRLETGGILVAICLRGDDTTRVTSGEDETHADGFLI